MKISKEEIIEALKIAEIRDQKVKYNKIKIFYPDTGPLRRELYPKHTQYFAAGLHYRLRLILAANRIGKTETIGGYETVCHLTGDYPDWWPGHRFEKPIDAWAAGDTSKTVRDIIQHKLLGPYNEIGTGLIPADRIQNLVKKPGVPEAYETIYVNSNYGISKIDLKSYDQKRESFQGTKKDLIWLDEEPPLDIHTECLLRTMKTGGGEGGHMLLTFTPLMGLSEVVMTYLPQGKIEEKSDGQKYVLMATWDDAPHLSEEEKQMMWAEMPSHQRDARSKGIPQLGSGAIYPIAEEDIVINDFEIPEHWVRAYALDVGWQKTAAVWGAWDRENDIVYLYRSYYQGEKEPYSHAYAIKQAGDLPGVIDPAANGRNQKDGTRLLAEYQALGLDLEPAFNAVEAGIHQVYMRMTTGRLKVFKSLQDWLAEFRIYRRDEKGKIIKSMDHLMDTTRYLIMSGLDRAQTPLPDHNPDNDYNYGNMEESWMA